MATYTERLKYGLAPEWFGLILLFGNTLLISRERNLPKIIWEEGPVAAKVSPHWLE